MTGILVTGAGGQLGRDVVAAFDDHDVVGASHADLDVTNRGDVLAAVTAMRPGVIVHCAAWTDVDGCELDSDRAFSANALATRYVADAAERVGAHLCYVSTDFVFDGASATPYLEWDEPRPLSLYGRSKLAGEEEVGQRATIVRSSWLYGESGQGGFVRAILDAAARGVRPIRVVDDQRSAPTATQDLARAIRMLVATRATGCFHVTNQGEASRYELARHVLEWAAADPGVVEPIATCDLEPAPPAARPPYSVLDNAALRLGGFPVLPDWRETFESLVRRLV